MRLSVIIIALNQEANIGACLASVRFADEIVVVDTGSTDRTVELARAGGARVVVTAWQGFAGTKNFALDQARGDWVFSLDTDERVPPALKDGDPGGGPGRRPPERLPGAPEELLRRPLDQASGLVPGLHPAPLAPGARAASGTGRSTKRWRWPGRWGCCRPRWIIIPTAISRNTPPARTATPGWPPGRWPSRAAGPGPGNSGGGRFSPFCSSISSRQGFLEGALGLALALTGQPL